MNYILIPLRHQEKIIYTKVDMLAAALVCRHKWSYTNGYARTTLKSGRTISMHRLILGLINKPQIEADHINHDKLDNRKHNLRLATRQQNNVNALHKGKNKYRGVHQRSKNSFRVLISSGEKRITVGSYKTAVEGARAYNVAALKYHGKFAVLNEVPEVNN